MKRLNDEQGFRLTAWTFFVFLLIQAWWHHVDQQEIKRLKAQCAAADAGVERKR
jgi:hypothetical protein